MTTDAVSSGIPTSVAILEMPAEVFTGYSDIQENIAVNGNTCVWGNRKPTEDDMAIRHGEILVTSYNSAYGSSGELVVCTNLSGVEITTDSEDNTVRAEQFYKETRNFGIARTTIEMKDGLPMSNTVSSTLQGGTGILNTSRDYIRPGQLILGLLPDPNVHRENRLVKETKAVDPTNIDEIVNVIDFSQVFQTATFRELTGSSVDLFSRLLTKLERALVLLHGAGPGIPSTLIPGFTHQQLSDIEAYMTRRSNITPDSFHQFVKTTDVSDVHDNGRLIAEFQDCYAERLLVQKSEGQKVIRPLLRCSNAMTTHYASFWIAVALSGGMPNEYFFGSVYPPIASNLYILQ